MASTKTKAFKQSLQGLSPSEQLEAIRFQQGLSKKRTVIAGGAHRTQYSKRHGGQARSAKAVAQRTGRAYTGVKGASEEDVIKATNTMNSLMSIVNKHTNDTALQAKFDQMDAMKVHALLKGGDGNPIAQQVFNYKPDISDAGWANENLRALVNAYETAYGTIEVPMSDVIQSNLDTDTFGAWGVRR